jgi:hypothetical protein
MKHKFLILGLCIAVTISGAYSEPGRGSFGRSGGGYRSRGTGSKGGGLFSGWFSSSKKTVPKYTAPKPSAPNYSSLNKDSNSPAYGWNLNKPVGPPPAYPGLEKVSVGSHNAPPAYSKTAPSLDKSPPPYSSINHLGTGVSSGSHLGPPPPYSAGHPPAPPAYNTGFHAAQPPVTILNNYPAPAQGSSFGSSFASNALFYGLGSMNSRGSSVHHYYHNSDSSSRNSGASTTEVTSTSTTTTVPTIENLSTVINATDTANATSSLSNSEPVIYYHHSPALDAAKAMNVTESASAEVTKTEMQGFVDKVGKMFVDIYLWKYARAVVTTEPTIPVVEAKTSDFTPNSTVSPN